MKQCVINNAAIVLLQGDITRETVDAMVTAANSGLRGGGGVDGAIHRAAGPQLLEACREIGGCKTGNAVLTPSFGLEKKGVRAVVHAVGPIWSGGAAGEEKKLRSAYRCSLEAADKVHCRSIAFPSISTGVYGYPVGLAAKAAIEEVKIFLRGNPQSIREVRFVLFDNKTFAAYEAALTKV